MKQHLKYVLFVVGFLAIIAGVAMGKFKDRTTGSADPIPGGGIVAGVGFLLIFISVITLIAD